MGYSGKPQVGGLEMEDKRWVIAGIPLRAPLKHIYTNPKETEGESEECSTTTTPTGEEARIPSGLACPPPPPRKRKPSLKCNYGVREFFTPPDLESVFIRRTCWNDSN